LTPDAVSAVLADFRNWLTVLTAPAADEGTQARSASEGIVPIDLHTLLGQFLAVRQEVNLQTRAVRAQQEQNAETLRQLTAALDTLRQSQTRGEQAVEEAIRPLLKTLIDLYDALALAGREVQRMRETVQPSLEQLTAEEPPAAPRSFWASLFRPSAADLAARQERERLTRENSERVRQMLASLVTGYTMSLQRIERALRQHGLDAIPTTGERFDPERMEVVEAVLDSGRLTGEVIEEVRRGYLWNGRVFRYAQVRVAKG
jgi:molecular chaperone GrpE